MQVLKVFIKGIVANYKTICKNSNCNNQLVGTILIPIDYKCLVNM